MASRDKEHLPKVLVLTRNAWNNNNCTGNTLTNFFSGWSADRIANAFFRAETISNSVCRLYYRVSEQELFRRFINKKESVGKVLPIKYYSDEDNIVSKDEDVNKTKNLYSFFSRHNWVLAKWLRDFLWASNSWRNSIFEEFINAFDPDVIYMPCYDSVYMHRILWYVHKKTNARVVLFAGDDTYTLKQFSYSPLFWLNRLINRRTIKKSVKIANTLFVISEMQKEEYEKIFRRECILLRKGQNFEGECIPKSKPDLPIRLVYTGNMNSGRWKTLAIIASAIKDINRDEKRMVLDIYSLSSKSKNMINRLNIEGSSRTMPPATETEIEQALAEADVLVFVEPFDIKEKLKWRLSFSTKIVDYLASSRPILAFGPPNLSSMNFLIRHDAAICVTDVKQINTQLRQIVDRNEVLCEYTKKAWECGRRYNKIDEVRSTLLSGLAGGKID